MNAAITLNLQQAFTTYPLYISVFRDPQVYVVIRIRKTYQVFPISHPSPFIIDIYQLIYWSVNRFHLRRTAEIPSTTPTGTETGKKTFARRPAISFSRFSAVRASLRWVDTKHYIPFEHSSYLQIFSSFRFEQSAVNSLF
jgi:hypothetical protein